MKHIMNLIKYTDRFKFTYNFKLIFTSALVQLCLICVTPIFGHYQLIGSITRTLTKTNLEEQNFVKNSLFEELVYKENQIQLLSNFTNNKNNCKSDLVITPPKGNKIRLIASVIDYSTKKPLASRVYLSNETGQFFLVKSADEEGLVRPYKIERDDSKEIHTAVSAHSFFIDLDPGRYQLVVERGKEFIPLVINFELSGKEKVKKIDLPIHRWINMAKKGWYSGDTHVHLPWNELELPLMAEDLNVGLPLSYWNWENLTEPPGYDENSKVPLPTPKLIEVEKNRVIWPVNTEYEIFSINGKAHTLGAIFALNHTKVLPTDVPPIKPAITLARQDGAILDMDKHNWPWSMMLPPVVNIDLFELSNNHVWRTKFLFNNNSEFVADYMHIKLDSQGRFSERGWLEFGFQTYYTLLNCGFHIAPSAGTATGVHPVPLGFSRVYVYLPNGFNYNDWIQGLKQGRSFVTTGPMLNIEVNKTLPGDQTKVNKLGEVLVKGTVQSLATSGILEIIHNGEVYKSFQPKKEKVGKSWVYNFNVNCKIERSGWIAVRFFENQGDEKPRFAHSGPVYVDVPEIPLRPRRVEVEYLIGRMKEELKRNKGVLSEKALEEYEVALDYYSKLLPTAL